MTLTSLLMPLSNNGRHMEGPLGIFIQLYTSIWPVSAPRANRGCIYNVFDLTKSSNLKGICRIFSKFNLSSRVRDLERKAKRQPTRLIRTPTELVDVMMSDDWRAWPVHFSVPANSQVFARFLVDAGFEGVLYRSAKGAKKCLAVFTRQMVNSNSHVGLHPDRPDNIENAELNSTNCLDL